MLVTVARAADLAEVCAHVAGDARQGVAGQDHVQGTVALALSDPPGVFGHVLADGALRRARRGYIEFAALRRKAG